MNQQPTYLVHGDARRTLKKKFSLLRSYADKLPYYNQIDRDCHLIYCGQIGGMSKGKEKMVIENIKIELTRMELVLNIKYFTLN